MFTLYQKYGVFQLQQICFDISRKTTANQQEERIRIPCSYKRRTVFRKASASLRLSSIFFSSSRRSLILPALSPCSRSYLPFRAVRSALFLQGISTGPGSYRRHNRDRRAGCYQQRNGTLSICLYLLLRKSGTAERLSHSSILFL